MSFPGGKVLIPTEVAVLVKTTFSLMFCFTRTKIIFETLLSKVCIVFMTTVFYPQRFGHKMDFFIMLLSLIKLSSKHLGLGAEGGLNWWKNGGQSVSENSEWCADNEENCLDSKQSARLTHLPSPHAGTALAHNRYHCLELGVT